MAELRKVTLRNGGKVPEPLVGVVGLMIKTLMASAADKPPQMALVDVLALYELVRKCEDPNHSIFSPEHAQRLQAVRLVETDAQGELYVRQEVRDVVLSMIEWPVGAMTPIMHNPFTEDT